ncbi:MAG: DUF6285 domain-containing protein [Pseudomonadota bacterium]
MHDQPSVQELVAAVKSFIDETASPQLTGHAAFHARVASNALATVLRDLEQRPGAEAEEREGLLELLGGPDEQSVSDLNRLLSDRIQSGELTAMTPGLLSHLKKTVMAQVEIDQPRYSGLKTAKS